MSRSRFAVPVFAALAAMGLLASPPARAQQPAPQPAQPEQPAQPAQPAQPERWQESPAKQADPPLLPGPATPAPGAAEGPPTSSSGTDVAPSHPAQGGTFTVNAVDPAAEAQQNAKLRELEARIVADERRMRRLEERVRVLRHVKLGAFAQPQFIAQSFDANASPNQLGGALPPGIGANDVIARPDGTTTNTNMFRMRRTRLRATFEAAPARLYLEIDPFPLYGAGTGYGTILRDAEVTATARWAPDIRTEFGAGVIMPALRSELRERSDVRPFIERTWATQNILPAERDLGVHARTLAMRDRLVLDVGILNGQRLGEPRFVQQPDLNRSKDLYAHLRYGLANFTLGFSTYYGRGQIVDGGALRFKQYPRWWTNYELAAHYRFARALGITRLVAELGVGQNMDTGVNYGFAVPAIPAVIGDDVLSSSQRAVSIRFEQEVTRWALAGYRYDFYTTDSSIKNNARDTHAFVTVLRLSPNLRWMNELDWVIDNVHAPGQAPPSRQFLTFSSVLQAGF
jgi:hypothetical protein